MTATGTPDARPEVDRLLARVNKLAEEKSYLQLIIRLMEQLNPLPGLEDMVRLMLLSIMEGIGGTNIKLYYWIGAELHYTDFFGGNKVVAAIDDQLAAQAAERRAFIELPTDAGENLVQGDFTPGAWIWVFPLLVGQELVGVIKLENLLLCSEHLRVYLPIFFSHAALILSNKIRTHTRQQAEAALQIKTEELDSYFNTALDLFAIFDSQGHFRKLNPAWPQTLGYELSELEERHFMDFVHPDDAQATDAAWLLSIQQPVLNFTNRYRHKDGSYRWLEWQAQPKEALIYTAARDITERKRAEHKLAESESRFREIFDSVSDAIVIHDAETGRILDFNRRLCEMYGYTPGEALAVGYVEAFSAGAPPYSHAEAAEKIRLARTEGPQTFDWLARARGGRLFWVEVSLRLAPIGKHQRILAVVRDISERKQTEASLRLAASVFANSYEGFIIADTNNVIIDVNPAFTRITGYLREEALGQSPALLKSGRHGQEFYADMWQALQARDFWRGEIWNRRKTGEVYAEMLAISVVRDDAGRLQHYIGVFSDISLAKAHEAELDRIAHYDPLTGIPNRRLFADRLGQAINRTRRGGKALAVCYLDLDGFKPVNDRHGHATGDRLLIEITERLKGVLRAEDTVARLGGDEFVLLFTDLAQTGEIRLVLERVLETVSAPVRIGDIVVSVSASIGATLYPADDADADTLLRHADQTMYRAKEAGKNRYHLYDPGHDRQKQERRHQLRRLCEAFENSEFVLHYQPKVDLLSKELVGAEALIRWRHPEQGLLLPESFLHYLNGNDLEIAVGEWVINSVLGQIAAWNALGLPLKASANVSANHLLQADFAERLRRMLEGHPDVAPSDLELEILESAALSDIVQASRVLADCQAQGVRFALDDFGTGYSSLTYFRRLPVDILKIDQSFVRDMLVDPDDLGIVESVVRLANAFNRVVVAEGMETPEHGALLVQLGCRLAQGYGIAPPMPAEQLPGWLLSSGYSAPTRRARAPA